jgi:hypothetical protein
MFPIIDKYKYVGLFKFVDLIMELHSAGGLTMVVVMGEIVKTSKGGGEQQLQKLAHLVT